MTQKNERQNCEPTCEQERETDWWLDTSPKPKKVETTKIAGRLAVTTVDMPSSLG